MTFMGTESEYLRWKAEGLPSDMCVIRCCCPR